MAPKPMCLGTMACWAGFMALQFAFKYKGLDQLPGASLSGYAYRRRCR